MSLLSEYGARAQARGTDHELPALMHRADLALYRAKALGRNRVETGCLTPARGGW